MMLNLELKPEGNCNCGIGHRFHPKQIQQQLAPKINIPSSAISSMHGKLPAIYCVSMLFGEQMPVMEEMINIQIT